MSGPSPFHAPPSAVGVGLRPVQPHEGDCSSGLPSSFARRSLPSSHFKPCPALRGEACTAFSAQKPAEETEGVALSNTPPLSSIAWADSYGWTGAEDWFEWSFYVQWQPDAWKDLRARLEEAKFNAAQEGALPMHYSIPIWGRVAEVSPSGIKAGTGSKGLYFAYTLEYEGIKISIADRIESNGKTPNLMLRASGEQCLLQGAYHCFNIGKRFVRQLGGEVTECKLSRVDICLDLPGVPMTEFLAAYQEGRYVSRTKAHGVHSSSGTTVYFGSAPLTLRIYDKLAETNSKANPTKKLAMIEYRWGGKIPACAVRVEFELRRDALKSRGINSVEDYYEKRADLVFYLTHNWIRLTKKRPDRKNKNQSKIPTLEIWEKIQNSFQNFSGEKKENSLAPLEKEKANVRQMFKQAFGVLKSAAEHKGKESPYWKDFEDFFLPELKLIGKCQGFL